MALLHSLKPIGNRAEERIYDLLAKSLDDEWQVWHEPEIQRTEDEDKPFRPDFILLHRNHGLFVLEVKGWVVDRIKDERSARKKKGSKPVTELLYDFQKGKKWVDAPFDQLGKYKSGLRRQLTRHSSSLGLSAKKINTLFDGAVAFTNISRSDVVLPLDGTIADRLSSKLASVLLKPGQRAFYKSEIKTWEECRESVARDLSASNGSLALSPDMIDTVRGVIHPEIRLPTSPSPRGVDQATTGPVEPGALRVLSQAQEYAARYEIGSGHRILFGVAGSGKTMILIARARWQAMLNPVRKILVLCFNRALSLYIAKVLEDYDNIDVMTFHAWVRERLGFMLDFEDKQYDSKLLDHLRERGADKYHSILIDECQDWHFDWFKAILYAAEDPLNGDFLIVGDGSQSIYRKHGNFSWEDCGISPQKWRGTDSEVSINFERNYRNTPQIIALASSFACSGAAHRDNSGTGILSLLPNPKECFRSDGLKPKLRQFSDRTQEMEYVATCIRRLINSVANLEPCDFAVVYPGHFGVSKAVEHFSVLLEQLTKMSIQHDLVQGGTERNQERLLEGNTVKILNIKQMKGLEQKVCFVVGVDEYWNDEEELLYVAMTRATDWLYLTWSGKEHTPIINRLMADSSLYTWCEDLREKKNPSINSRPTPGQAGINKILDCLNAEKIRCTYGSVAEYLKIEPIKVGSVLGQRRPEASWVVGKNSLRPTGYTKDQIHPDLDKNKEVITTGIELQRLLERYPDTQD